MFEILRGDICCSTEDARSEHLRLEGVLLERVAVALTEARGVRGEGAATLGASIACARAGSAGALGGLARGSAERRVEARELRAGSGSRSARRGRRSRRGRGGEGERRRTGRGAAVTAKASERDRGEGVADGRRAKNEFKGAVAAAAVASTSSRSSIHAAAHRRATGQRAAAERRTAAQGTEGRAECQ